MVYKTKIKRFQLTIDIVLIAFFAMAASIMLVLEDKTLVGKLCFIICNREYIYVGFRFRVWYSDLGFSHKKKVGALGRSVYRRCRILFRFNSRTSFRYQRIYSRIHKNRITTLGTNIHEPNCSDGTWSRINNPSNKKRAPLIYSNGR